MQLPRGTFCEIRKKTRVSALLNDIKTKEFSGICTISFSGGTGTFVFRSGTEILAKLPGIHGDAAWQDLLDMKDREVDAAFSSLNEAQINLSLEFNKSSKITVAGAGGPPTTTGQPIPVHHQPAKKPLSHRHLVVSSELPVKTHNLPGSNPVGDRVTQVPQQVSPGVIRENSKPSGLPPGHHHDANKNKGDPPCQEPDSFDQDIETIGGMDLDNVTEKIRTDCRTIVKQLHLEHLMER